jgi:hypothetical protein
MDILNKMPEINNLKKQVFCVKRKTERPEMNVLKISCFNIPLSYQFPLMLSPDLSQSSSHYTSYILYLLEHRQ